MRIHDRQDPQLVAQGQLLMNEVHGPDFVWPDCLLAIIAQLGLHPPLRVLVPELQGQFIVNSAGLLDVDHPPLPSQQDMHAPIAVAQARFADFLDPSCDGRLIGAPRLVVERGGVSCSPTLGQISG